MPNPVDLQRARLKLAQHEAQVEEMLRKIEGMQPTRQSLALDPLKHALAAFEQNCRDKEWHEEAERARELKLRVIRAIPLK
jgi:hypothetical protein